MAPFLDYLARNKMARKEHQLDGVRQMVEIEKSGRQIGEEVYRGGLLADEMGLGKSAQVIGTILENIKHHTLLVVPRAILEQWHKTILDGTGHNSFVYHGTRTRAFVSAPVVITTHGKLVSDFVRGRKIGRAHV